MADDFLNLVLPPARMIMGSVYKPNTKNSKGELLVYKTGEKKGQPRVEYFIGVAIPKVPGHTSFDQTEWGTQIKAFGQRAWGPGISSGTKFAWKVLDGDSTNANTRGARLCDREGARGHWVLRLTGGAQPQIYIRENGRYVAMPADVPFLKCGHYVVCSITVSSNKSADTPGVYLNPGLILHVGFGPEIHTGPDADEVFGTSEYVLPAGASRSPVVASAAPPAVAAPPVAVVPHAGILAPVMPPPAPPAKVMTAKAAGATYEQYVAAGWSDAQMVQAGLLQIEA